MDSVKAGSPPRGTEVVPPLLAIIGALIVGLLIFANVQLSNVGGVGGEGGKEVVAKAPAPETAAALPAPTQGTSNAVLSEELKRLSQNLSAPLDSLHEQLGPLAGLTTSQAGIANSFQNVAESVHGLRSVQTELSTLSDGIGSVVENTEALASPLESTNSAITAMATEIGVTSRATQGMLAATKHLNESIENTGKTTSASMEKVSTGIEGMSASIGTMNQSLASSTGEITAMSTSLKQLNGNMEKLINLFCTLLTSETECPAQTTAPAPEEPQTGPEAPAAEAGIAQGLVVPSTAP